MRARVNLTSFSNSMYRYSYFKAVIKIIKTNKYCAIEQLAYKQKYKSI